VAWHSAKAVNRRLIGNAAGKLSEFLMTRRTDVVRPRRILARVGMESGSPGRFNLHCAYAIRPGRRREHFGVK
jgi:hypothetical protein